MAYDNLRGESRRKFLTQKGLTRDEIIEIMTFEAKIWDGVIKEPYNIPRAVQEICEKYGITVGYHQDKILDNYEPWKVMEKWTSPEEFYGFLKLSALNRIVRAKTRNTELEDMIRAHHELGKAIEIARKYHGELWNKVQEMDFFKEMDEQYKKHSITPIANDVAHGISWATEQLSKGFKVRRPSWVLGKYYNYVKDDAGQDVLVDWQSRAVKFELSDILDNNWEIKK